MHLISCCFNINWKYCLDNKISFFFFFVIIVGLISSEKVFAEEFTVSIPFGAYNPELNTPAEVWYDPPNHYHLCW